MIPRWLPWLLSLLISGPLLSQQTLPPWEVDWQAGHRERAVDALETQLEGNAEDTELWLLLAQRQLQVHRFEGALLSATPLGLAGRSLRAQAHYLLGHFELAIAELDPQAPSEVLMLVDAHEILGHGPETEAALLAARAVLGADNAQVAVAEGRAAARAGQHQRALVAFRRALAIDPFEHSAYFGLGRSLLQLGQKEDALAALARHRELVPLMDQREHALRAIDLAPLHAANHAQLGDVDRAIGRLDQAEASYRRAAQLASSSELTVIALRHARLLHEDRNQLSAAIEMLDQAALATGDIRLTVRAGDLLLANGQGRAALARFDLAQQARPTDTQIAARRQAALAVAQEMSQDNSHNAAGGSQ
ncbi:MAG: tetratricopeptide (TPR) repeat protein [Pseudohongiellaceae bacterium]|jgi:tetratricopeptide (TPR) repeat protein